MCQKRYKGEHQKLSHTKTRDISFEMRLRECGLTTLGTRRLTADQIEMFKIIVMKILIDMVFFRLREIKGLEDMELH